MLGRRPSPSAGERALDSPAITVKAPFQRGARHSYAASPLGQSECLASVFYLPVVRPIVLLLFLRRPAAIVRLVAARVFDAIKRQAGRTLAHVFQECLKGGAPAVADGDALGAILGIGGSLGIVAAVDHPAPTNVGRGGAPTQSVAVPRLRDWRLRSRRAAAGIGVTYAQRASEDDLLGSAIAAANPRRLIAAHDRRPAEDGPSAKSLSREFDNRASHGGSLYRSIA